MPDRETWGSEHRIFFKNKFILFIYFWLRWVFAAARGLFSSCGERGLLFLAVRGLLIAVASPCVQSTGSRRTGFSSCGSRALEHRLSSCGARA